MDLEERVGVSKFKHMKVADFRTLDRVLLIEEFNNRPVAAVVPYSIYMQMQGIIIAANERGRLRGGEAQSDAIPSSV